MLRVGLFRGVVYLIWGWLPVGTVCSVVVYYSNLCSCYVWCLVICV